ncbi:DNA helicase SRS2 [Nakaseomyces bracarensis]|uniref:DNA helicase SRS2 n=1 Tax=Nakaseomyces bracarensis TaxID=273131 RepID=UPI0038714026
MMDRRVYDGKVRDILVGLNEQQCAAVTYDHTKALQIIAGPGTGKTKVLTSRVAYLILQHNINPHNIIVTTFTNKAAKEMKDRLAVMLKDTSVRVGDIMIGTFHSICLRILGRFGHKVGLQAGWRIVDEKEMETILTQMIEKMPDQIRDYAHSTARKVNLCLPKRESSKKGNNGSDGPEWEVHQKLLKKHISRLKSSAILPEEYKRDSMHDPALAYFYETCQLELSKLNTLDFDDLLMFTFRLLTKERCLPWIEHVLVDEFQDTNSIQIDLMFLLARGNHHISRGLTVVGDPDQSIYAFRYALSHNFQEMVNKCPLECSQVILVENYRSSQNILDTSETLIKQQVKGRESRCPLKAQFNANISPVYMNFPAYFLEAPSIVREILYLKALPGLFTYNDFSILVRKRKQIKTIEKSLIEFRIPYKIVRGRAFWELKEISSMLNLVKCVISDTESIAIISSLCFPNRGFGDSSAEKVRMAFSDNFDMSAYEVIKLIDQKRIPIDIPKRAREVLNSFILMIDLCRDLCNNGSSKVLSDIFDTLYEKSGLKTEFLYKDGKKKAEIDEGDPDFNNPRHKNVLLLKSYFTNINSVSQTEADDETNGPILEKSDTTLSVNTYILDFLNSLSLFSGDSSTGDNEQDPDSPGSVTICTIHGAKGLEWPVVFIPGCEDNTIPAIFSDEKGGQSDDDDDDELEEGTEKREKKNQNRSLEESIDEERRMFFVAQTRAKYLLYLSSVTDTEGPMPRVRSRFLTTDVLRTTADHQQALENIVNVKTLYSLMNFNFPGDTDNFSMKQLLDDYKLFIEDRRERLYWTGNAVRSSIGLDLTKNKMTTTSLLNDFTTASTQLRKELQSNLVNPSPRSMNLDTSKRRTLITSKVSPQKKYAPQNSNFSLPGSPNKKKEFAPRNYSGEFGSPNKSKKYAPEPEIKKDIQSKYALRFNNASNVELSGLTDNRIQSRPRSIIDRKKKFVIKSQPININQVSGHVRKIKEDIDFDDYSLNTTASELLHNPNNLKVEEKPIIASAKILADAAKKKGQDRKTKDTPIDGIKKETSLSQFDIFSQLSRAKKKAKLNDSEVIIID